MERSQLDLQPYAYSVRGDAIDIYVYDAPAIADIVIAPDKVVSDGRMDGELPQWISAYIQNFSAHIERAAGQNEKVLRAYIDIQAGATDLPQTFFTRLNNNLHDDDDNPVYRDISNQNDINGNTIVNFYFSNNIQVQCLMKSDRISIYARSVNDQLTNNDIQKHILEMIQRFSRVTAACIDSVIDIGPVDNKGVLTLYPPAHSVIQSIDSPMHDVIESIDPPMSTKLAAASNAFESIGGQSHVKQTLLERARLFLMRHELAQFDPELRANIPVLLHGKQGTGKTTLARAYADAIGAQIHEAKMTSFSDRYIGQSARNTEDAFNVAKQHSTSGPVVFLLDEFDSLGGHKSTTHEEYQKVVNVLKVQLEDIVASYPNLVVIACANSSTDAFDPAIVRAGRFDAIHVDYPSEDALANIWTTLLANNEHTRSLVGLTDEDLDVENIESGCYSPTLENALAEMSSGLNGSDIKDIIKRCITQSFLHKVNTGEKLEITKDLIAEHLKRYRKENLHRINGET